LARIKIIWERKEARKQLRKRVNRVLLTLERAPRRNEDERQACSYVDMGCGSAAQEEVR